MKQSGARQKQAAKRAAAQRKPKGPKVVAPPPDPALDWELQVQQALNPQQERFVGEYVTDLNATQAAIRAGYSEKSAAQLGYQLLQKPSVQAAIATLAAKRAEKVEITADRVLRELQHMAEVDVGRAFDDRGALLPVHAIPEDVRRAIASLEIKELRDADGNFIGYLKKVRFWDKRAANVDLGKYLKLFVDRVEHSADSSFAELVLQSVNR